MNVSELIPPSHVLVGLRVADKATLLEHLARRAAAELSLDEHAIFDGLSRREALGSTGLGKGFALPHARFEALSHPFALFARTFWPIEFAAIDGRPVDLVVLLLTPRGADNEHLATLAAISRQFRDESFLNQIRGAPNSEAICKIFFRTNRGDSTTVSS